MDLPKNTKADKHNSLNAIKFFSLGISSFVAAVVLLSLLLNYLVINRPKSFTSWGCAKITLTSAYKAVDNERFVAEYVSKDCGVAVYKNPYVGLKGCTEKKYAVRIMKAKSIFSNVYVEDGITYFDYTDTHKDIKYYYWVAVILIDSNYWVIQCYTFEEYTDRYSDDFLRFAKSLKVSDVELTPVQTQETK